MPKSSSKQTKFTAYPLNAKGLKNCIATSVVLTTAMYVKPGLKPAKNAGKNIFQNVCHLKMKSVGCYNVRVLVDSVWPCSLIGPHKAPEKYLAVNQA